MTAPRYLQTSSKPRWVPEPDGVSRAVGFSPGAVMKAGSGAHLVMEPAPDRRWGP